MKSPNKIELVDITELIPYANNARVHTDEQIAQIAGSIREFGFNNPVLIDTEKGIIAGHGRVLAGRKLNLEKIPCIRLDHLTDTQKKAYILADNKIALNSSWNMTLLDLELGQLQEKEVDLSLLGFSEADLARLADDQDHKRLNAMVDDGGDLEDDVMPTPSSGDKENNQELFPLSVMLEHDQRNTVFKAFRKAKEEHDLENSGQAIWLICKEYLNE